MKIMALVIAGVMTFGAANMAMADDTYKITINNNDQTGSHTYSAYKILKGDLVENQLQNIDWALSVEQANALLTAAKADKTIGSKFTSMSLNK